MQGNLHVSLSVCGLTNDVSFRENVSNSLGIRNTRTQGRFGKFEKSDDAVKPYDQDSDHISIPLVVRNKYY